jgi:hypothetical protein
MPPFDISFTLKKPFKGEVVGGKEIVFEDEETVTFRFANEDNMQNALKTRDILANDLKEKGIEIKRMSIFPSKERR